MPRKTQDLPIKWDYERDQVRQWTRSSRRYIPVEWMAPVLAALVKTHRISLREFFYRVTPDQDFVPSYDERNESD